MRQRNTSVERGSDVLGDSDVYDLLTFFEPGLFVDVGAAAGHLTRRMLEANPESEVLAFEPFPGNHPHFDKTIGSNPRVHLRKYALGPRMGSSPFFVSSVVKGGGKGLQALAGYSSHGKLVESAPEDDAHYFDVRVSPLDQEVPDRVRFCKIDVQGGEAGVLRGAADLLRRQKIDTIYIEFDGVDVEPLHILSDHGFRLIDGEYMILPRIGQPDPSLWTVNGTQKLSTGEESITANRANDTFSKLDAYCDFIAKQRDVIGPVQCDVLAVSPAFSDRFNFAVKSVRERRAAT